MKILCILGKAAVGKDYITSYFLKENLDFKKAISYTTRPKRDGEIDGKDYYFIDDETFNSMKNNNEFLENTSYNVNGKIWSYGYAKGSFDEEKVNIVICNPYGFSELIKSNYKNYITALYLTCGDDLRYERYFKRDSKATLDDWKARLKQDDNDFKNIINLIGKVNSKLVVNTTHPDLPAINNTIRKLIN